MKEEADFKVALTTSGFTVITDDGDNATEIDIMIDDIPACVCELKTDLPLTITKNYITRVKTTILNYLKILDINSNLRSVFIGLDPEDDLTSLVSFHSFDSTTRIDRFFKRWDETQILMFQYTIKREQDGYVVACMGTLYRDGQWQGTRFLKEPTLTTITLKEFEK